MADLVRAVELICQHLAQISRKQDLALEKIRRLLGGQRDMESAVTRRPTTSAIEVARIPVNPVGPPLKNGVDFRVLNARLADSEARSQLEKAD
ncbi:hypothetical protein AAHC03_026449 [Spirometra sp. Aus1]